MSNETNFSLIIVYTHALEKEELKEPLEKLGLNNLQEILRQILLLANWKTVVHTVQYMRCMHYEVVATFSLHLYSLINITVFVTF